MNYTQALNTDWMTSRLLMLLPLSTLEVAQGKMLSVSPQCCQLERVETK